MERNCERRRLNFLIFGCAGLFFLFLFRFFYVQIIHNGHYTKALARQSIRRVNLYPERGEITDADGQKMAVNAAKGRLYPFGERAGQVLGFVGKDGYGLAGVEYGYDRALFGEEGWTLVRQDARQKRFFEPGAPAKRPEDGVSIELTLNVQVQEIVEYCLREGVAATGAVSGTAVALNPANGDILAMANVPFFNPNAPAAGRERRDWSNGVVSMIYEPGSTFKLITAAAALESGAVREDEIFKTDNGKFKVFDQYIHDAHLHGDVSFVEAIAVSSNIAFAKIGMAVGSRQLYRYVRNFGFGQKTGVELPGEESGLFKPVEKWSGRTLVTVSMGHEISVTPLQLASAYAAVANGGVLFAPRIVRRWIRGGKTVKELSPVPVRRVVSEQTAKRLVRAFQTVVDSPEGTGKLAGVAGLSIAGKTGTAEKINTATGEYHKDRFHASFVGFFPAERPQFLCLVILNEPSKIHTGGLAAAPIFRDIAVRLLSSPNTGWGPSCLAHAPAAGGVKLPEAPELSGMPADSALSLCGLLNIPARLSGGGGLVAGQSFRAGRSITEGGVMEINLEELPDSSLTMPKVVGLSLRQAAGLLNHLGMEVVAEGRGVVTVQLPAPGVNLKKYSKARICRLTAGVI